MIFIINCRKVSLVGWAPFCRGGGGVLGSNAGRTTNQALKIAGKVMLAVIYDLVSVQVIASLGGEVKPLALTPPSFLILPYIKKPTLLKRVTDLDLASPPQLSLS